jgi:hypothetical protein
MMGRKISFAQPPASPRWRLAHLARLARLARLPYLRLAVAAAACVAAAWIVQDAAGSEIGGIVQKHGEKLELLLRGKGDKANPAPPPRQRAPDEPIQPWERVSV